MGALCNGVVRLVAMVGSSASPASSAVKMHPDLNRRDAEDAEDRFADNTLNPHHQSLL